MTQKDEGLTEIYCNQTDKLLFWLWLVSVRFLLIIFFLQFLLTKSKVKKKKHSFFEEKKYIFFSPIQQWNKRTILEEPQQLTRVIRSLFPQRPPAAGSCCDVLRWMHGGLPKQHCQQTQPVPPWQERPVRWILPGPGSMMHRSCPWCCGSCP